jgi:hypothetical protein
METAFVDVSADAIERLVVPDNGAAQGVAPLHSRHQSTASERRAQPIGQPREKFKRLSPED